MDTKEETAKREEKLTELLAQAEGHPMMQKIKAEKAAAILATRQEAALKIEALRNEEADIIPRFQADRQEKELKYQKAKVALQAASDEFQKAHAALSSESNRISREIGQQEQVLIESADPLLDDATTFFREKLDWLRKPGRINRIGRPDAKNIFTWKKTTTEETNMPAINDALRYCQGGIRELEKMKLCPELDMTIIEGMKAGVPDIEVYTEFTGEKPMERTNTDLRSLLPSDSQMEWEIGKLNEKFKKLMKNK